MIPKAKDYGVKGIWRYRGDVLIIGSGKHIHLLRAFVRRYKALAKFFKVNIRPTPDYLIMNLPGRLEFVLAGLILLIFLSSGWISVFFLVLVCLCLTAYFLLGLAVIHAISRTWNGRSVFITAIYFIVFLVPWLAILVSIAGLLESRIGIRSRF